MYLKNDSLKNDSEIIIFALIFGFLITAFLYASVGFVVNMATGTECGAIQLESIGEMLARNKEKVNLMFLDIFTKTLDKQNCGCLDSIVNL